MINQLLPCLMNQEGVKPVDLHDKIRVCNDERKSEELTRIGS